MHHVSDLFFLQFDEIEQNENGKSNLTMKDPTEVSSVTSL